MNSGIITTTDETHPNPKNKIAIIVVIIDEVNNARLSPQIGAIEKNETTNSAKSISGQNNPQTPPLHVTSFTKLPICSTFVAPVKLSSGKYQAILTPHLEYNIYNEKDERCHYNS